MCNVIDRCKGWKKINDILFYAILFYSFCIITFASDCDVVMLEWQWRLDTVKKRMSEAVIEDHLEVRMDKEEDAEDMLLEDAEASGLFANVVDLDPAMDTDLGNLMTKNWG